MGRVLRINDAAWLWADKARTPMHIGLLFTFEQPQDAPPSYVEDLVARWRNVTTFSAPFNLLAQGAVLPRWRTLPDRAIALERHLRHTVVPGGAPSLGAVLAELHSERLDRRFPLWECHVLSGGVERTWSLYVKVHHSQLDGIAGLRMARRAFSVDADARGLLPPWAVGLDGPDQSGSPTPPRAAPPPPAPGASAGRPSGAVLGTAASIVGSLARTYGETVLGAGERLRAVPYRAPRTLVNQRISGSRRVATQRFALERLRGAAAAAGSSLNDVYVSVCGGALRRYLLERQALPSGSMTAIVPVSVASPAEPATTAPGPSPKVGTAITFAYAFLGTDVADPVERLRAVSGSTALAKARLPRARGLAMDTYTTFLMLPFLGEAVTGLGGHLPPAFNTIVSNVPGFTEDRFCDGSRLLEYYPVSLLFHGQGLNITAVSNASSFCVGFTACPDTVPEVERLASYAEEALEELEEALGRGLEVTGGAVTPHSDRTAG